MKTKRTKPTAELPMQNAYPEFQPLAIELADQVCRQINHRAPLIPSSTRYQCQGVLEELIKILYSRI